MVQPRKSRQTKATTAKRLKPSAGSKPRARSAAAPIPREARIIRNLARLQANPSSAEFLAQAQSDIEQRGLETFLRAVAQTPAAKRVKEEAAQRARRKAVRQQRRIVAPGAAPVAAAETLESAPSFGLPGLGTQAGDVGQVRQVWSNCISNQIVQPLRLFRPGTLTELCSIIQLAATNKCKVKAVGSGHSFTEVATTTDFLIDTHGLNHPLPLETKVLKSGVDTATLFETEGGILIRDLNEALWNAGLGLINMGGYDGQTIAGAVSTSTHGTGIEFGPLSSAVVSLTMVVSSGKVIRIEPRDGITDPARWAANHPTVELVQDDDWFYSCQVSIGCMGVVYSLVLQARERYWMKEERTLEMWSKVKQDLQAGVLLAQNRHCEVLINPYLTNGDHTCLITKRNPVLEPVMPPNQLSHRNDLVELVAQFPSSAQALLDIINAAPNLVPTIIDVAMESMAVEYVDRSYRVFNLGAASKAPAYGSEIGFPMSTYLDAIECIFQIAAHRRRVGDAYLTSPFSLRFVKASKAYLSMMYDADTCMIELLMLDNTVGGKELLRRMEYEMYAFGGRPHWGLLNFLSGGNGLIESMYPKFSTWLSVLQQLDPDGMFDNAFTERCGISKHTFVRN